MFLLRIERIMTSSLGLIILLIGLGMLGFSFYLAYNAYSTAKPVTPSGESIVDMFSQLIAVIIQILPQLVWIALMIAIGGIVMSKGISLMAIKHEESRESEEV